MAKEDRHGTLANKPNSKRAIQGHLSPANVDSLVLKHLRDNKSALKFDRKDKQKRAIVDGSERIGLTKQLTQRRWYC
jgi:transcription antitermination factor NusA-like protein